MRNTPEKQRIYNARYRAKHLDKLRAKARDYARTHMLEYIARNKKLRLELREQVLCKFGYKCARCPESERCVLQIDHVNGGGYQEMKIFKNAGRPKYLRKVLADTEGNYQLLCANCNIKKYFNTSPQNGVTKPSTEGSKEV